MPFSRLAGSHTHSAPDCYGFVTNPADFAQNLKYLDTVVDKADFARPHQYAEGFRHVLVNGKPVLVDGKMTGERAGRVLYGPAHEGR